LKTYAAKVPDHAVRFLNERPLWQKITLGSSVVGYLYIRYKWMALNGCGVEVIQPKLLTFGTTGQYLTGEGVKNFAYDELLNKNRRTIGFYRLTTPVIFTVDTELIKLIFTTHFASFPHRNPASGSIGGGPIFGHTLDIVSDMVKWKRMRATVAAGFSTRQLNEMIPSIDEAITRFALSLKKLNNEPIDGKTVASKFAVDAFTAATFSTNVTDGMETIQDFGKAPLVEAVMTLMNPTIKLLIPLMIPYGGELMDMMGVNVLDSKCAKFFENFCGQLLHQRKSVAGGRTNDFLNLMIKNEISDTTGASKGLDVEEIIGMIFVFFVAGYETTASTITSALFLLMSNRQYIDKIQEEADRIVITDTGSVSEESMPWTCAVINEVMRIASPVGMHLRVAEFDGFDELTLNGITFPDKCNVEISADLLHMHPDFWHNPSQFYPERFVENPELVKEWFYLPFGGGPRNCVGMRLALLEIRLGLLRILQNFDVEFAGDSKDVKMTRNQMSFVAFEPKNPEFTFKPRQ